MKVINHQHAMQNPAATIIVNCRTGKESIVALPAVSFDDTRQYRIMQHSGYVIKGELLDQSNVAALPGYEEALIMGQCQGVWDDAEARDWAMRCPSLDRLVSLRAKALRR